jgi:hypothetical protein
VDERLSVPIPLFVMATGKKFVNSTDTILVPDYISIIRRCLVSDLSFLVWKPGQLESNKLLNGDCLLGVPSRRREIRTTEKA